jgi:opacity protein-like surface antigen
MNKALALTSFCLAVMAHCGQAEDDVKPGLWDIAVESGVAASPDWKPQAFAMKQCLTEGDAKNPDRLLLGMGSSGATGCDFLNRQYSGNTLSFDVSCAGTLGLKGHGQVTYTATSVDGFLNVTVDGDGKLDMQNKIHASYLGDCPATDGGLP